MSPFSLWIALGAGVGLALIAHRSRGASRNFLLEAALWVLLGALIGGRAAHVGLSWAYYSEHLLEVPQVWLGGLSGSGAFLGGAVTTVVVAWIKRVNLSILADVLFPLGASLSVASWLGCWYSGDAYGLPTSGWWGVPAPDAAGIVASRLPVQLAGAILSLGLLALSEAVYGRWKPGLAASIGSGGMGLIFFGLSFFRDDPAQILGSLRFDAWAGLLILCISILPTCVILLSPAFRQKDVPEQQTRAIKSGSGLK